MPECTLKELLITVIVSPVRTGPDVINFSVELGDKIE